jgi:photosystem II stability/assembly factor-like uncharacterized protein
MKPIMRILFLMLAVFCGIFTIVIAGDAQTWTAHGVPNLDWISVGSSADGTKLVAGPGAGNPGPIYTSTDSGVTWIQTAAPYGYWDSIASSTNGANLIAVDDYINGINGSSVGEIYTSIDSGQTWNTNNVPILFWYSSLHRRMAQN